MMVSGGGFGGHLADPSDISYGRERHHSTASLLDSIERRTQRTYRYGIALVCIGATLNWLGFAQGNSYIDPLRYLGVACVISGSFCVCLAMCRWLGRPISLSAHQISSFEEDSLSGRTNGDVQVYNVAVPMFVPSMHEEYNIQKPPDYEIVAGEPPPYDEAIKLTPGSLIDGFSSPSPSQQHQHQQHHLYISNHNHTRKDGECEGGSPPPPYHPSPSCSPLNTPNSPSNLNLISSDCKYENEIKNKREDLLGLMMIRRGERSEEGSLLFPNQNQHQNQQQLDGGENVNLTLTAQLNLNSSSNHLQVPLILTDGNGNSSPILIIDPPPPPPESNHLVSSS